MTYPIEKALKKKKKKRTYIHKNLVVKNNFIVFYR